jgi:hypothetical protein
LSVLARQQPVNPLDFLLTRLNESRQVSVYAAIERLMQGGEAVGFSAQKLGQMLDRGVTLEELFQMIESEMERAQRSFQETSQSERAA